MLFTVIQNGRIYAPQLLEKQSLLIIGEKIVMVGEIDVQALEAAGLEGEVIDAQGCLVLPGLIDPHEHLIGAGGEQGFASRLPEVRAETILRSGITTVVGLMGTDTVTRDPHGLYAKVQQLNQEGLSAYMYTGGFELPVRTITDSVINDLVVIDQIIGTGEIAISDPRWIDPQLYDLAHVVSQTKLGGQMAGKAGVTHFHVGPAERRLTMINSLLDSHEISAEILYVTHITRSPELLKDAIQLVKHGVYVDMDAIEQNIAECIQSYLQQGAILPISLFRPMRIHRGEHHRNSSVNSLHVLNMMGCR